MSSIIITKGKLLKDSVEIKYIDRKKDGKGNCGGEYDMPPHKDLINAFEKLKSHAALLGEFINASAIEDKELLEKFIVKGFSIQGGEDMNGVILSAQKTLNSGKLLGFNTPTVHFEEDNENAYQYLTELVEAIEECRRQLKLYLGGKHGDPAQQELPFEANENRNNNGNDFENDPQAELNIIEEKNKSGTDELEPGETNDAMENERIKNGVPGAAKRGRKKKVVTE